MTAIAASSPDQMDVKKNKIWSIIGASSAGTVIEWYDFYIFGSLATVVSPKFYGEGNQTLALLLYLSTFAVGFVVRPFGALVFGHLGDKIGRKYTFLATLLMMGGATVAIGLLPTYAAIGVAAPGLLILIRILQGLALGGEYGGAATYVAEHVPDGKRGFYTSFIQITATMGLFISLGVILLTKALMEKSSFESWGWRIPFLLSSVLVLVSLAIRVRMHESPIFQHLKSTGKTSNNPLKEAFRTRENRRRIAITLFGLTAGQGVVWYTGQFYALFYLKTILKVDDSHANKLVAVALLISMPLFVVFGWLSDRIGRKRLMLAGMALAVLTWVPIYHGMHAAVKGHDVVSVGSKKDPLTGEVKLVALAVSDEVVTIKAADGTETVYQPGEEYPASPTKDVNNAAIVLYIFLQMVFVCMVYGPIAAYLVEAFPASVRYTSMSLPYHIGNGIFGGLLPLIGLSIATRTNSLYAGLWYPVIVATATVIIGGLVLKETAHVRIWDELKQHHDEHAHHGHHRTEVKA